MARINKQLQREISLLLEQRVKNDSAKNAIITGVDCARDLETARVFFTTLDASIREQVLEELQSVKGPVRAMLGQVLTIRRVPALEFLIDRSSDYAQRIDGILHKLGLNSVKANDDDDYDDEVEEGELGDES